MDTAALITLLSHLGLAAAAWRLASALKIRVDDHESRIVKHDIRLGVLEKVN